MAGVLHCLVYHDHQGFHSRGLRRRHSGQLQLVCTSCTVVCLAIRCCAVYKHGGNCITLSMFAVYCVGCTLRWHQRRTCTLAVKQPVPAARRFNSCTTLLLQKQSLQRLSAPAQVQRHCCIWCSLGTCVTTLSCMTLHVIAAAAACNQTWVHLLLSTMVAP